MKSDQNTLVKYMGNIPDPRCVSMCDHKLIDILVIAICAVLCGASSWAAMAEFGHSKQSWLESFLELSQGIPSHDTFYRLFCLLDALVFEECFTRWMTDTVRDIVGGDVDILPIDGKCLRGSRSKSKKAIHMVSAFSTSAGMVLCQRKVDEKSNEITAVPELLKSICLKNRLVTADALNCQKEIVSACIEQGGNYVLPVKGNQGNLHKQIKNHFDKQYQEDPLQELGFNYSKTTEKGHGRRECRMAWVSSDLSSITETEKWEGIQQIGIIQRDRQVGNKVTMAIHYYIMSQQHSAAELLDIARKHWEVENKLHWRLDVGFQEDQNQTAAGNAAENMSILNRICLNVHTESKQTKGSISLKRLSAGWDNKKLVRLLSSIVQV